ncbi:hypothetical protein [Paraburkholderia sp. J8-2]|uniref:hypothetical protein n=1 Tax=Paraburkholderia sp. J8-2 TaxID=2805440 RepID=UPI002AB7A921|nr:hypothetical protein [Paraburkholderia sp. J8-2]
MNKQSKNPETALQKRAQNFVSEHVYRNVSAIVAVLHTNANARKAFDLDADEVRGLVEHRDFGVAVLAHLETDIDVDELHALLSADALEFDTAAPQKELAALFFEYLKSNEEIEEFADEHGIDPERTEVNEQLVVSDYLAARLEEKGEVVEHDFLGLTVWGRCEGGQMVHMDKVIRDIVRETSLAIVDPNMVGTDLRRLRAEIVRGKTEGKTDADLLDVARTEFDRILGAEGEELAQD